MSGNFTPFKEDGTSYKTTGIPCGNPKRYQSRGVIRMHPDGRPYRDQRLQTPAEDIETEGDRQLNILLQKQLDTKITLSQQLSSKKAFGEASLYSSQAAAENLSGTRSLVAYQDLTDKDGRLEQLRQYGLTDDELRLKLESEGFSLEEKSGKKRNYGMNPEVHRTLLAAIEEKISDKEKQLSQPDRFSGAKPMGRHESDLERAISHDREKANLLGCLLTDGTGAATLSDPAYEDKNHPINHLTELMKEVVSDQSQGVPKKSRRKRRGHRVFAEAPNEIDLASEEITPDNSLLPHGMPENFEVESSPRTSDVGCARTPKQLTKQHTYEDQDQPSNHLNELMKDVVSDQSQKVPKRSRRKRPRRRGRRVSAEAPNEIKSASEETTEPTNRSLLLHGMPENLEVESSLRTSLVGCAEKESRTFMENREHQTERCMDFMAGDSRTLSIGPAAKKICKESLNSVESSSMMTERSSPEDDSACSLSADDACGEPSKSGTSRPSGGQSNAIHGPWPRKSYIKAIPVETIEKYRLSVDQIRELPRFPDYDPGTPSKTLYLKNLARQVTEEDLASLFQRFEATGSTKVTFKLMTGRMRGQAFVTMDSTETAAKALALVNGYQFKDKPIIMQYGRKT